MDGARSDMNSKHCGRVVHSYVQRTVCCDQFGWNTAVVCAFTSIEVVHHQALHKTEVKEVRGFRTDLWQTPAHMYRKEVFSMTNSANNKCILIIEAILFSRKVH